jgi:hypothetical protein
MCDHPSAPEYTGSADPAQYTAGVSVGTAEVVGSPGMGRAAEAGMTCFDQSTPMTLPALQWVHSTETSRP